MNEEEKNITILVNLYILRLTLNSKFFLYIKI